MFLKLTSIAVLVYSFWTQIVCDESQRSASNCNLCELAADKKGPQVIVVFVVVVVVLVLVLVLVLVVVLGNLCSRHASDIHLIIFSLYCFPVNLTSRESLKLSLKLINIRTEVLLKRERTNKGND